MWRHLDISWDNRRAGRGRRGGGAARPGLCLRQLTRLEVTLVPLQLEMVWLGCRMNVELDKDLVHCALCTGSWLKALYFVFVKGHNGSNSKAIKYISKCKGLPKANSKLNVVTS